MNNLLLTISITCPTTVEIEFTMDEKMEKEMFCFQCQETAAGTGCTKRGVCGKTPEVAKLQDALIYLTKGLSFITTELRKVEKNIPEYIDILVLHNLFTTITNANFDENSIIKQIKLTIKEINTLKTQLPQGLNLPDAVTWNPQNTEEMQTHGFLNGVLAQQDPDKRSLIELITYGLKGLCAYAKHAAVLKNIDPNLNAFVQQTLAATLDHTKNIDELLQLTLETGKYGVTAMALLDAANTSTYGNPQITEVSISTYNKPGILISGHDLRDLEMLLQQSENKGIDIYTHSEMLPAHYYPKLKKYPHLVANYGNAWWMQTAEFETFNGPILMTTNCIVPPKANNTYLDKLYTTGAAAFPGAKHIEANPDGTKDFSAIIEHALKCQPPTPIEDGKIVGGFAHEQVFALADKVVEAVKSGAIKKFVVMGGCDGRSKARSYYTEFAQTLPKDTVILTAGCAKYRYNKLPLADINGIPRVLDAGQCNDSYSLALIALKLKEIFNLDDINQLPIIYNIAWYEQKAVIVLLALLYLGVKNIHLGPTLPAFLSSAPNVLDTIVKLFGVTPQNTPEQDLQKFFG